MTRANVVRSVLALFVAAAVAASLAASRLPRARVFFDQYFLLLEGHASTHWQLFCLGQIVVAACGVLPASVMAVMAGALYGLMPGLFLSLACTMMGGWLAFALSRSVLRPWIEQLFQGRATLAKIDQAVALEGWRFVCLLRMSPIMPFAATSYGLGLTQIGHKPFLLGTLATLPTMAGFVAIGAYGKAGIQGVLTGASPVRWLLLLLGVLTVLWAVRRINQSFQRCLVAGTPLMESALVPVHARNH